MPPATLLLAPAPTSPSVRTASPSRSASIKTRSPAHRYWIDWLRFLAAAAVMVEHVCTHNHLDWEKLPAASRTPWHFARLIPTRLGRESVLLFFVLSGFLVGGATIRRVREGTFDPRAYALDRATRLYVPLLPALALTVAVSAACGLPISLSQYFYHVLALQGVCVNTLWLDTPLWTLAYETWFYVLAGAAAVLAAPGARGRMLAYTLAALSLGLFMSLEFTFLFCWLLGALAAGLTDAVRPRRTLVGWTAAAVAVAASAGYQAANGAASLDPAWAGRRCRACRCAKLVLGVGRRRWLVACLGGGCAGGTRLGGEDRNTRGPGWRRFSYTLYLVHYPVMCLPGTSLAGLGRRGGRADLPVSRRLHGGVGGDVRAL